MKPEEVYKFCPKCGGRLKVGSGNYLNCPVCRFRLYINPVPCNGVIIENEKGEILLVKRRVEPQKDRWDIPGGFIAPDESFEKSVKREIKEELGINVIIGKIIGVYNDRYLFQKIDCPTLGIIVSAKISGGNLKVADDVSEYKFFEKDEIFKQYLAFKSVKKALENYLNSV